MEGCLYSGLLKKDYRNKMIGSKQVFLTLGFCFIFAIISLDIAPLALVLEFVLVAVRPRNLEE
jgi:hypothetical protein